MLFLLCGRGAKIARERGHDPIPLIFETFAQITPALQKSGMFKDGEIPDETKITAAVIIKILSEALSGKVMDDLAVVVWWGVLAAQPDVELEEIEVLITPAGLYSIVVQVWPRMLSYSQDLRPEDRAGKGDGGSEGN